MTSLNTASLTQAGAIGPCLGGWDARLPPPVAPEVLEPAARPLLRIQGVAREVTSARLRQKMRSPRLEHVQVGELGCYLMHESEPGWPPAYRLTPGRSYEVQAFTCKHSVPSGARLPQDVCTPDEVVFFAQAHAMAPRRYEGDQRRVQREHVGAWTDGLMLVCAPDSEMRRIKAGVVYKVVVRRLPA